MHPEYILENRYDDIRMGGDAENQAKDHQLKYNYGADYILDWCAYCTCPIVYCL